MTAPAAFLSLVCSNDNIVTELPPAGLAPGIGCLPNQPQDGAVRERGRRAGAKATGEPDDRRRRGGCAALVEAEALFWLFWCKKVANKKNKIHIKSTRPLRRSIYKNKSYQSGGSKEANKQLPHQFAAARSPPHALLLRNAIDDGSARCPALARCPRGARSASLKPSKLWSPDKGADRARATCRRRWQREASRELVAAGRAVVTPSWRLAF